MCDTQIYTGDRDAAGDIALELSISTRNMRIVGGTMLVLARASGITTVVIAPSLRPCDRDTHVPNSSIIVDTWPRSHAIVCIPECGIAAPCAYWIHQWICAAAWPTNKTAAVWPEMVIGRDETVYIGPNSRSMTPAQRKLYFGDGAGGLVRVDANGYMRGRDAAKNPHAPYDHIGVYVFVHLRGEYEHRSHIVMVPVCAGASIVAPADGAIAIKNIITMHHVDEITGDTIVQQMNLKTRTCSREVWPLEHEFMDDHEHEPWSKRQPGHLACEHVRVFAVDDNGVAYTPTFGGRALSPLKLGGDPVRHDETTVATAIRGRDRRANECEIISHAYDRDRGVCGKIALVWRESASETTDEYVLRFVAGSR